MELSAHQWEMLFNIVYTVLTALVTFFIFVGIKAKQPKYYGLLIWAFFLILCASFFVGLYGESLEALQASVAKLPEEVEVKKNLISNLKILVFIVPGVMAAVAANLITEFLLRGKPSPKN